MTRWEESVSFKQFEVIDSLHTIVHNCSSTGSQFVGRRAQGFMNVQLCPDFNVIESESLRSVDVGYCCAPTMHRLQRDKKRLPLVWKGRRKEHGLKTDLSTAELQHNYFIYHENPPTKLS